MHDIRIYDYDFNLLHIEPDILSAYWILSYNGIGTFEGTFPLQSGMADVVMHNKYLILVQGDLQALVTAYLADDVLTVFGKTPNWILSRRTYPAFSVTGTPAETACSIVEEAFSSVPNFVCQNLVKANENEKEVPLSREKRSAVSDIVPELLNTVECGHRVRLDIKNKQWIFEVYAGKKLSLILSEANRNLTEVSISDDAQSFFSSAWYKKDEEEEKIEGTYAGLYDWDTVLFATTQEEAKTELAKKEWTHTVKGSVACLKYKTDYALGDTVRVQVKKGTYTEDTKKRITGVELFWENEKSGEKIRFEEDFYGI